MTTARRELKVKVIYAKLMGQANAVGPISIEGSFFLVRPIAHFQPPL